MSGPFDLADDCTSDQENPYLGAQALGPPYRPTLAYPEAEACPYGPGRGFRFGATSACYPGAGEPEEEVCAPPLRVIHVGPSMLRAGVDNWLQGLLRFLDRRRVDVVKCLVTAPDLIDPLLRREMGVPVEAAGREEVRQAGREADALLYWGPAELGDWLADCRPRLSVFMAHGEGGWTKSIRRCVGPVTDHVIAVSRRTRDAVAGDLPSTIIPNGVDTARIAASRPREEVRRSLGFGPGDFVLGYVGRFSREKRPAAFLDALALLPPTFKGLMVGWGPLRPELLDRANRRVPGRYAFAAASRYVGDYFAAADALVLPSSEEGFALVILEAMFWNRPVIATPVGCAPEVLVDRVNGLVVDGTPESIAEAAERLRRHPHWAAGLAAEGRAYAETHGHARTMARRYEEVVLELWRKRYPAEARGAAAARDTLATVMT